MKLYRIYDVNDEDVDAGIFETEEEAELWVERRRMSGEHVVEIDTVEEAAEEMLEVLKTRVLPLIEAMEGLDYDLGPLAVAARDVIDRAEGRA